MNSVSMKVVQMIQDREGGVVRREVGCQSDSAERRDAAVQVDLLSWRHCAGVCGVPWHCVSVRDDEPGGGALLQHCMTHSLDSGEHSPPLHLLCSPLRHTQLPTMPLSGPPAPQLPEPQQTTSLPSMPLCETLPPVNTSAPPPGLIAPLSPRLAEEEEEGGAKPVTTEETERVLRPRRKTVGPPIRYLLQSEELSHGPSAASHSRVRGGTVKRNLERLRRAHDEEQQLQGEEQQLQGEEQHHQGEEQHHQGEEQQLQGEEQQLQGEEQQLQEEEQQLQGEEQQLQGEEQHHQGEEQHHQGEEQHHQGEERQLQGEERQLQGEEQQLQGEEQQLQGEEQQLQGEEQQLQGEEQQLQGEEQHHQGEEQHHQGEEQHHQGEERQLQGEERQLQGEEQQLQGEEQQLQGEEQQLQGEEQQLQGEEQQLQGEEQHHQGDKEDLIKHDSNESFKITAEKKRRECHGSEGSTHSNMSGGKSRKVRSKTLQEYTTETQQHCRKRGIRRPATRIQRTRAEGENQTMVRRKKEEENEKQLPEEEGGHERRFTEEQRKEDFSVKEENEDGVRSVETEQAGRPRRTTVGPTIRYLLESEEQSHGPSAANHSKAWRPKVKRKLGIQIGEEQEERKEEEDRRGRVKQTEEADSSRVEASEDRAVNRRWQLCQVCGLTFTCQSSLQLHLCVHRAVRRLSCHLCHKNFSKATTLRLHYLQHHHGNPVGRYSNRAMPEVSRSTDGKQDEEDSNGERKERKERSKLEEQRAPPTASTKAPDWSRRTKRVCRSPQWWINYQMMKRRQVAKRWRGRLESDGERGSTRRRVRAEDEKEVKQVCLIEEEGGGEPRQQGQEGEQEGRRRRDGEEEEEKEEKERQTEVKKEVVEQPQRLRRKMVGPPIRYLLESEEKSSGKVTANEDKTRAFQHNAIPQKKSKARGGALEDTAMIDRPEDTEQTDRLAAQTLTERQTGRTNQDGGNRPTGRGGRPNKVMLPREAGGRASEMIDRSDIAGRQVNQTVTETQTGHTVAKRQKTVLSASTKAPDWLRISKCESRNRCWGVDCRIMTRRRQEKDEEKWRKRKRYREEGDGEAEVEQIRPKKKRGGEEGRRVGGGEKKVEEERQTEVKKEVVEQPRRLRRKMVGPPIRYLLESEEPSSGAVTASEDRSYKQNAKPQKKSKARGRASEDTAMIDRPEDTEQTDRLAAQTLTERQTGHTMKERQTGSYRKIYLVYVDLHSRQVTIISPCYVRLQRLPLIG